jgi:hypothetical protein
MIKRIIMTDLAEMLRELWASFLITPVFIIEQQ